MGQKTKGEASPSALRLTPDTLGREAVPLDLLPAEIEMSWQRSLGYGLTSEQRCDLDLLEPGLLADQLEKNHHLLIHAQPVMDGLFEQIVDTQSVIALANDAGCILHSCGDPEFLPRAEKLALAPGALWAESSRGTNAIGTALAMAAPVAVTGDQHFFSAHKSLTCTASPIFDPQGCMTGILDITGDHRSFNRHTMALVRMSVQMIENRMFASAFTKALIIRFHARPEFVGTLCEGMAAFDEAGSLLSANRNACFQFGQNLQQMRGASFSSLFGQAISRVFDHLMVRSQDPLILTLNNGIRVKARADFSAPHLHSLFRRTTAAKPPTTAAFAPATEDPAACGPALDGGPSCPLGRLQTGDPQVNALIEKVRKVVGRDISILIQGETGTGKELLANAIHCAGPRAQMPFVAVNCAAIPEGLIESELFGYEEGAFTGARRKGNIGRIVQANGGTLFLDEIGDMPASLQGRLLRVLQERVVMPLGSVKAYPVDIAVICATHQQIRELVSAGRFRQALYFRLNGLTVKLPPLRLRTDFDALLKLLLQEFGGATAPALDPEVRALFRHHPWPGNLRQLSNLLRTAVIMAEDEGIIRRQHLPDDFIEDIEHSLGLAAAPTPAASPLPLAAAAIPPQGRLEDLALLAIEDAISRNAGNISAAARELGISRATLYRKLPH